MNQTAGDAAAPTRPLPLTGLRVVEFTHMVMGPTCGMVLADLGAEVIKIEPVAGENTRRLLGAALQTCWSRSVSGFSASQAAGGIEESEPARSCSQAI